jgi:hypothetical protein
MTDPVSQVTASATVVMLVQWLKTTKLVPFINAHSAGVNRVVAWAMATGTALGLHIAFDSSTHTLVVTGLSAAVILHGAWDVVQNIAMQELVYHGVLKTPAPPGA